MRDELKKLKLLRDTVIGIDMEMNLLEKEIDILNTDIHYMKIAKSALKENLKILKKEKVIAMANQYKKSIDELQHITNKIQLYERHRFKTESKLEKLQKKYNIYAEDYEFHKNIVESQKVILYFDENRKKREK